MKGVILAGGKATRLRPLTFVTNKHLLPVYSKPMIFYPLEAMAKAGIKDVLIITSAEHCGHFMNLLRSGQTFGLRLSYEIQEEAGGLAQALSLSRGFAEDKDKILMILGDNIFRHNLKKAALDFQRQKKGAKVFFKEMENCAQYGVPVFGENGKLLKIEEKPKRPKSKYAQTGVYMYDDRVFELIKKLKPSPRGEIEITDLNNLYIREGTMSYEIMGGWWIDAGTSYDELLRANKLVAELVKEGEL